MGLESLERIPSIKQLRARALNGLSHTKRGAGTRWSLRDLPALIHSSFKNTSIIDYPESNLEKGTFHTSVLGPLTQLAPLF